MGLEHVHNGIKYEISLGTLTSLSSDKKSKDVIIPHYLPNGVEIKRLGQGFCKSSFNRVTISEGIREIPEQAFSYSDVVEVFWPNDHDEIPYYCFAHSRVKRIHNIDYVRKIGDSAFAYCYISDFYWPKNCAEIPRDCFRYSHIEEVHVQDSLSKICTCAFADVSSLKKLDLSKVFSLDIEPCAFRRANPKNIVFPYYIDFRDIEDFF